MTQLYNITWQSPHGKQVTSSHHTEAQARALIEQNKQHTPDWTYTVEPPLPNLQAMLDAANKRIAELEAVCREVVEITDVPARVVAQNPSQFYYIRLSSIRRHLLDTLPPSE